MGFTNIDLDDEDAVVQIPMSTKYQVKPKKEIDMKKASKKQYGSVQEKAVEQAVNFLNAAKAAYRIVTADGKIYESENFLISTGKRMLNKERPYGSIAAHFKPYVEPLQVGESACIPFVEHIHRSDLQSAVSAWMCGHWGKGSYTTLVNKERQHLEVLRVK